MNQGLKLTVYPVKDLEKATKLFTQLLGVAPYAEGPYYVGFKTGDGEVGLDPNGFQQGLTGPLGYYQVSDIEQSLQTMLDNGAQVQQAVKDVGGGRLIAWVRDADNNLIGLMQ